MYEEAVHDSVCGERKCEWAKWTKERVREGWKKARNKGEIRKKESRKPRAKEREGGERRWKELACLAQEYKEK